MVMITETCRIVDARVENVKYIEQLQSELTAERELTGKLVSALEKALPFIGYNASVDEIVAEAERALALVPADRRK